MEQLLTPEQVAEVLQVDERTLANWRAKKPLVGPTFIRVGKYARYRDEDVRAYLVANEQRSNVTPIRRSA